MVTNCACGKPLHYNDFGVRKMVDDLTEELGEFIVVEILGKKYKVQRHYIALHGLKAQEIEQLVKSGIVATL